MVDRKLGRGLEFFLSGSKKAGSRDDDVAQVELSQVSPSPFQPREDFDPKELDQLAASLRSSGLLQPILVRPVDGKYQIIAGERRWRAAKLAGLERIPALIRDLPDETVAVLALVENVQRTDLNAIEKAKAFRQIQTMTKGTPTEVAKQVGLDRSTVTNLMRLLDLPRSVQSHVSRGTLTMGHARALLALAGAEEQEALAEEILRKKLSVRQVEAYIQALDAATEPPGEGEKKKGGKTPIPRGRPVWLNEIEETLVEALGASVVVNYGKKRSRITIECVGREEFERVYELLKTAEQNRGGKTKSKKKS